MLSVVSTSFSRTPTVSFSDGNRVSLVDLIEDHPVIDRIDGKAAFNLGKQQAWHQANQLMTAKDRQIAEYQTRMKTAGFTAVA